MNKTLLKDTLGWGIILWLIGFVLGIILYKIVPVSAIGWVITPIGIVISLWVLIKKISAEIFSHYLKIAVAWTLIAVILDYLVIVKGLNPADGYYKSDVYLYYFLMFLLPVLVGARKNHPE